MKRSICLYFQIHQPFRLRTYRFFDIGADDHYYDDYQNRYLIRRISEKCYLPANATLLNALNNIEEDFKVSFSISGTALEQFIKYSPEVIASFRSLAETGKVEFLAETWAHSLAALKSKSEFETQVKKQAQLIEQYFGQKPVTFRNTELVYSDDIAEMVAEMGFKTMLTEGAKHILGWKSPNFLYSSADEPKLNLLLRNYRLSDDIAFRFSNQAWSEWPLTADKFSDWLNMIPSNEPVVNLFMDYETFGEHQWAETGIFDFLSALPYSVLKNTDFAFRTPSEVSEILKPVSSVFVPYPISWADEERDLTAWLGNEMQDEAFDKIYALAEKMQKVTDGKLLSDWYKLQSSDHFYYMCTKWFSDGEVHKYFNPYNSPYEAFINYMNVYSDFVIRVDNYFNENPIEGVLEEKIDEVFSLGKEITNELKKKARKVKNDLMKEFAEDRQKIKEIDFDELWQKSDKEIKKFINSLDMQTLLASLNDMGEDVEERVKSLLNNENKKKFIEFKDNVRKVSKQKINASKKMISDLWNQIDKS